MSDIRRRDLLSSAGAVAAASAMSLTGVAFGGALARTADAGAATTTDLPYRGASELVGALAARQISAAEALEHAISRIEALDSRINAVVVRDFERARRAAAEADAALARGERRPLLGLPMTVKESFNVAGLPTTWGIPAFKGWQPAEDAIAVARLKAAGAVILGKTNLPFALSDWQSYNEIYGTTNNPWDLGRTPGGSSGGSAAALAAGFVPLELGSDISGSIRSPAHFCGVFGHKPSAGLVPLRGHAPPRSEPMETDLAGGLAVAGPLARSAGDLALALDVVAGPDESEATAYRLTLPPSRHDKLSSFRILVIDTHALLPTAATVRDAINRFAERLARAGARVARDSPLLPDLAQAARLHQKLLAAFTQAFVPLEVYQRIQPIAAKLAGDDDSLAAWRVRGAVLSYRDWIAASAERGRLRRQWRELFREWDVVVCPIMPTPAFPHDHAPDQGSRRLDIDGTQYPYRDQSVWPGIATTPGLPATAAPIDRSEAGLPIGVQIIGPYLEDRTTIGFAELIEREFGGFVAPPAFKA